MDKIPAYCKDKEPPIISYQYTNTVANKLFNFSSTLSNLTIRTTSPIHNIVNVTLQSFAVNHMAMLSQAI